MSVRHRSTAAPAHPGHGRQRGAALLMAMLLVALVATLAAAALWRQWRGVEVESAERGRIQAHWILSGALDWSRLILRQDAINGGPDYLAEPWAVPLAEARLSTFLSSGSDGAAAFTPGQGDAMDAFLTGYMVDLQGRLNAYQLVQNGEVVAAQATAFERLFDILGLPQAELQRCISLLQRSLATHTSSDTTETASDDDVPIAPTRLSDLARFGLSQQTLSRLQNTVTWLAFDTRVNLNTAPTEVLYASINHLDRAGAQKIVQARQSSHFTKIADVQTLLGITSTSDESDAPIISATLHSVSSSFFEANGQVRIDENVAGERSVLRRNGRQVSTLRRESLDGPLAPPSSY